MAINGFKNPLAVAIGLVFKRTRNVLDRTASEIASKIGVRPSFYRLVESGTNHMHISKAINVVDAFDGELEFDAVSKLLSCVSIMEVYGRKYNDSGKHYLEGLAEAVKKLSEYDSQRLKSLFQEWDDDFFNEMKGEEFNLEFWIKKERFDERVNDFLRFYKYFGLNSKETEKNYELSFLDNLPTIYFSALDNLKNNLLDLPVKIGFETLSTWEENNLKKFSTNKVIIQHHNLIVHEENLQSYRYEYLWEENFLDLQIIYLDEETPQNVKEKFTSILKNVLIKDNEEILLSQFEHAMQKVHFKKVSSNQITMEETPYLSEYIGKESNSIWAFTVNSRKRKYNVGFRASLNSQNLKLSSGESTDYNVTANFITDFEKIWQR